MISALVFNSSSIVALAVSAKGRVIYDFITTLIKQYLRLYSIIMATSSKKQKNGRVRKLWSSESMANAVKRFAEGGVGLRETARMYDVPYETLRRRVEGLVSVDCKPGPSTVLTHDEEDRLALYCVEMADRGFGLTRDDVMHKAFIIAELSGRQHPFLNEKAGRSWFEGFKSRHPRLTLRSPQPLSHMRAANANNQTIVDFFAKLAAVYARLNLFSKPMQIFNVDETGVSVVHKSGKVVTELGRRCVWSLTSAEKGRTHTIISCVSASGFALPPFMIYPRKKMAERLKVGAVPGTVFRCSVKGWINDDLYLEWFKFFLASIPPARPVLLLEDGHAAHITIELIEMARANDVDLLCFPSHTTHLLQPLDVGVFKSFKTNFSNACRRYMAANPGRIITTDLIATMVGEAWPLSLTPVNIMSGFRKCGIFPLNPGQISDRQTAPSRTFCSEENSPRPEETSTASVSTSSCAQEALFQKRYEEGGFDLCDAEYVCWLQKNHPEALLSDHSTTSLPTTDCHSSISNTSPFPPSCVPALSAPIANSSSNSQAVSEGRGKVMYIST